MFLSAKKQFRTTLKLELPSEHYRVGTTWVYRQGDFLTGASGEGGGVLCSLSLANCSVLRGRVVEPPNNTSPKLHLYKLQPSSGTKYFITHNFCLTNSILYTGTPQKSGQSCALLIWVSLISLLLCLCLCLCTWLQDISLCFTNSTRYFLVFY